jgi:hypothetical protein
MVWLSMKGTRVRLISIENFVRFYSVIGGGVLIVALQSKAELQNVN